VSSKTLAPFFFGQRASVYPSAYQVIDGSAAGYRVAYAVAEVNQSE
jgi:hypothetical protein